MDPSSTPLPAKVIFNPVSGTPGESANQLLTVLTELQAHRILPEVHLVEPDDDLPAIARQVARQRFDLVVVCGGDGTVDMVASGLVGSRIPLGIIPTGTQNNVALSLGIPSDIPAAAALLRSGTPVKADMGHVQCGETERFFIEACSVGLLSALFPAADELQKGHINAIGDLLSTLVTFPLSDIHLRINKKRDINVQGHMVLVSNMPYIGPHYQFGSGISCTDYALDVFVFADLNKLDLLGYAVLAVGGTPDDPRIRHFRVHSIDIETDPPMPVFVDGFDAGQSPVQIHVQRHAITIMAGELASSGTQPAAGPKPANHARPGSAA